MVFGVLRCSQLAVMLWLYDNLGFDMLFNMISASTLEWKVSMLKFHPNEIIDFSIYESKSDYFRINVALRSLAYL